MHSPQEDYYCRGPNQKAWPIRWMAPEQIVVQGRSVLDSMLASMAGNIWWVGGSLASYPQLLPTSKLGRLGGGLVGGGCWC